MINSKSLVCFLLCLITGFGGSIQARKERDQAKIAEGRERVKAQKEGFSTTQGYVHEWRPFPTLTGLSVNNEPVSIKPEGGDPVVVVFLASWCLPCQKILPQLKKLEEKYKEVSSFLYIFSHDLDRDAKAFSEVYKISSTLLATHSILKKFHNPQLPSIYVSDRDGWLLERYLRAKESDVKKLEETLSLMIVY